MFDCACDRPWKVSGATIENLFRKVESQYLILALMHRQCPDLAPPPPPDLSEATTGDELEAVLQAGADWERGLDFPKFTLEEVLQHVRRTWEQLEKHDAEMEKEWGSIFREMEEERRRARGGEKSYGNR